MATTPLPGAGDFPGNAHVQKTSESPARPEVKKVIQGNVTERKKSIWKRIGESFTGDDARSVGDFVIMDVIVPSAKSLMTDALTTAIERFFYGDGRINRTGGGYRPSGTFGQYTNYNRMSSPVGATPPWATNQQTPQPSRRARATHDFREFVFPSRAEAIIVLDTLTQMVDMYEVATIADFYDACGVTSEFTDRGYGWTDLREARVERVRGDGYVILFPQPGPLK